MKSATRLADIVVPAMVAAGCALLLAGPARAHCDTAGGPVITEARVALDKGDVTPVLKWVGKDDEAEIKAAFTRAVAVRAKGPEARELADAYFFETLVRVHRAGEGAPYTGIKDEPVEPMMAMADKALVDGSATDLIRDLNSHMTAALQERFKKAVEARKGKDTSVAAGRDYVEAYVTYVHFVEGLHMAITATGDTHHEGVSGH